MGGLTMDKLFVLAVIAVFIIGPERLPHYAQQLGKLVKQAKGLVAQAKVRAVEEMGPEFDVDWKRLDPKQYDPRRIIREALLEGPDEPAAPAVVRPPAESAYAQRQRMLRENLPTPHDTEST